MLHRRTCPGCGKVLTLRTEDLGGAVVCGACGRRFEAPRGMDLVGGKGGPPAGAAAPASPGTIVDEAGGSAHGARARVEPVAHGSSAPGVAKSSPDAARIPGESPADAAPPVRRLIPLDPVRSPWRLASAGALLLLVGLVAGWLVGRHRPSGAIADGTSFAADTKKNADLLALKSEAEALAIQGKLEEAHERYRRLAALAAGRDIRDPLLWDVMERAKVDQDRIYAILVSRAGPGEPGWTPDRPTAAGGSPTTENAPVVLLPSG